MLMSLILLFLLPFLGKFNFYFTEVFNFFLARTFFFGLLSCYLALGYLGSMPAEAPYVFLSQVFTFVYFLLFLLPFLTKFTLRVYYYI